MPTLGSSTLPPHSRAITGITSDSDDEEAQSRRQGVRRHQCNGVERRHERINLALPEACFVMMMALPFGSTRALPTAHAIRG
jgi:hypothetical protein